MTIPAWLDDPERIEAFKTAAAADAAAAEALGRVAEAERELAAARAEREKEHKQLAVAQRALATGGKPAETTWTKTRTALDLIAARVASIEAALADAGAAHSHAVASSNAAHERHTRLWDQCAEAYTCRLLEEQERLLHAAAVKRAEADAFFREHLQGDLSGPEHRFSLHHFDAARRAARDQTFHAITSIYDLPLLPEELVSERRRARGVTAGWGRLSESEQLALAHIYLTLGDQTPVALGTPWNTSQRRWLILCGIPQSLWPAHPSALLEVEPDQLVIEELKRGLVRALNICAAHGRAFDESELRRRFSMPVPMHPAAPPNDALAAAHRERTHLR